MSVNILTNTINDAGFKATFDIENDELIVNMENIYIVFFFNGVCNKCVYSVYTNQKVILLEELHAGNSFTVSDCLDVLQTFQELDIYIDPMP